MHSSHFNKKTFEAFDTFFRKKKIYLRWSLIFELG